MTRGEMRRRTQLRRECTDQPLPAPLLLPGVPPPPPHKPSLHETTFPSQQCNTRWLYSSKANQNGNWFENPHKCLSTDLVFLFSGIQFTPKVGPAEPSSHRHLSAIRQQCGAVRWQWVRGGYQPLRAAITKDHGQDGLHNRNYCLIVLEAESPRSRCQQGWFLPRPLSSACTWPSSPCVVTRSSFCVGLCPGLFL